MLQRYLCACALEERAAVPGQQMAEEGDASAVEDKGRAENAGEGVASSGDTGGASSADEEGASSGVAGGASGGSAGAASSGSLIAPSGPWQEPPIPKRRPTPPPASFRPHAFATGSEAAPSPRPWRQCRKCSEWTYVNKWYWGGRM